MYIIVMVCPGLWLLAEEFRVRWLFFAGKNCDFPVHPFQALLEPNKVFLKPLVDESLHLQCHGFLLFGSLEHLRKFLNQDSGCGVFFYSLHRSRYLIDSDI